MSCALNSHTAPSPCKNRTNRGSFSGNHIAQHAQELHTNHLFIVMLDAYRSSGGLARAQEVAAMFKNQDGNDLAVLAGWIVVRKVINFEWQSKIWLPLFQFNLLDMTLQPGLSEVLGELTVIHDDWGIATWFSRPNPWLANCAPADTLAVAAQEVKNAAFNERHAVAGRPRHLERGN